LLFFLEPTPEISNQSYFISKDPNHLTLQPSILSNYSYFSTADCYATASTPDLAGSFPSESLPEAGCWALARPYWQFTAFTADFVHTIAITTAKVASCSK